VVATEWVIFDEEASVLASLDLVVSFPDGSLGIVEWKHSSKLADRTLSDERMGGPLAHLHDCDMAKHALQLGLYARILERKYRALVSTLVVVNTHAGSRFFTEVPYLKAECDFLLERARCVVEQRRLCDEGPLCAEDGHLALDPVVCEDGKVRCKKVANGMRIRYRKRKALTDEAERCLEKAFSPSGRLVAAEARLASAAKGWESVFPARGCPSVRLHFSNWRESFF